MFGRILGEIKRSFGGTVTQTIIVAKPYCTPARDQVLTALNPYGVKIYTFREYTEKFNYLGRLVSSLQIAEVTVSAQAAAWAEYLILRSGKFRVYGKYVDRRNEEWAAKHKGQMPSAWKEGKPWIESSCRIGKEEWRQAATMQKRQ